MPAGIEPLGACLADWEGETVLLGFSGGGDSLALLHLATGWASETGSILRPVIIDHALRPESAAEADRAAGQARALGWTPIIARWEGDKPATGLQAAARRFRLETFARLAGKGSARAILLGHTCDDQAETVWRRLLAGSGIEGLSAMSIIDPLPLWPEGRGISLVRPLLGARRAALRDALSRCGENWIDDPSNTDPAFSRVRDRAMLAQLESGGFDPARLAGLADRIGRYHKTQAETAGRWLMRNAVFHAWGGISLDRDHAAPWRAVEALRAAVSGDPAPQSAAARKLAGALRSGEAITAGGAALGYRGARAFLFRDPGHATGRADRSRHRPEIARIGETCVWDGRFEIRGRQIQIRPFSECPSDERDGVGLGPIPPAARSGLLSVWENGRFQGLAGLDGDFRGVHWLASELIARNLFGDRPPPWFHTQLRDQAAQGSH
ncbi:tRNA lysidine(34) synthetase TilS [Hyphobacterium sp.]|uniref:tRNA lysidine(34) synthetase TilS n=1 Tax=Hyphobacterium sp. TaxID=2004662 RepID=UPI003B52283A